MSATECPPSSVSGVSTVSDTASTVFVTKSDECMYHGIVFHLW